MMRKVKPAGVHAVQQDYRSMQSRQAGSMGMGHSHTDDKIRCDATKLALMKTDRYAGNTHPSISVLCNCSYTVEHLRPQYT